MTEVKEKKSKKPKLVPINVWSIENVNDLDLWLAHREGLKDQLNIAQIKELRAIIALAIFDSSNILRILLNNGEKLHKEG